MQREDSDSGIGFKIFWLLIASLSVGLGIYFGTPYYVAYNAKKDLEKIGVTFSEQKFIEKACEGDEGSVLLFIKAGMNVNLLAVPGKTDGVAKSALHCAALKGNLPMAKSLLAFGADVNLGDDDSNTPLYYVAKSGRFQNNKNNSLDMAEFLISNKANVNASSDSGTPLIAAIQFNSYELVDYLIEHGANVKLSTKDGNTPLMAMMSRYFGNNSDEAEDRIRVLVKAGVDPNAKNKNGQTALSLAVSSRRKDAIPVLFELGANPEAPDTQGNTPLRAAFYDPETFKILLDNGANPNAKVGGMTLLQQALIQNNQQIIPLLLASKKLDINGKNSEGETPLHFAVNRNNVTDIQPLLVRGADPNAVNNRMETPLIKAARLGYINSAKALIDWQADVNLQDNMGHTALFYAKQRADQGIISGPPGLMLPGAISSRMVVIPGLGVQPPTRPQRYTPPEPQHDPMVELLVKHGAHV